jgi:hypothetical protein
MDVARPHFSIPFATCFANRVSDKQAKGHTLFQTYKLCDSSFASQAPPSINGDRTNNHNIRQAMLADVSLKKYVSYFRYHSY